LIKKKRVLRLTYTQLWIDKDIQKRDSALSEDVMKDIFKSAFFKDINFTEEEKIFLMDKMYVDVTIFHPIKKTEISCAGRVNDFELK